MHEVKLGDESSLMPGLITGHRGGPQESRPGVAGTRLGRPGGGSAVPGIPQPLQQLTCRPSSNMTATGIRSADSPVYRPEGDS
ncbi:hypothetical protein ABZ016_32625 [Streptomyces sp. NPDC006372]|uniref:hypothetical protein n=1 Tax=Streptomyces sp. NPDC006372 TaxID=3155599 RepID=UPI0033B110A5